MSPPDDNPNGLERYDASNPDCIPLSGLSCVAAADTLAALDSKRTINR